MNINIPARYKDLELKENDAMVVSLMAMIADEHGFEHAYNICSDDLRKIMNFNGAKVHPSVPSFDTLKKIFKIVYLNDNNMTLQFLDHARNKSWYTYSGRGILRVMQYKLTKPRNQNLWCYLLGMYRASKDLVQDSHKVFEHMDTEYAHTMNRMESINFRIETTKASYGNTK